MSGSSPHSVQDDVEAVRWALKGYQQPLALEALERLEEQIKQCRRERDDFEQRLHDYQTGRL